MIQITGTAPTARANDLARQVLVSAAPVTHVVPTGGTHDVIATGFFLNATAAMTAGFGVLLQDAFRVQISCYCGGGCGGMVVFGQVLGTRLSWMGTAVNGAKGL